MHSYLRVRPINPNAALGCWELYLLWKLVMPLKKEHFNGTPNTVGFPWSFLTVMCKIVILLPHYSWEMRRAHIVQHGIGSFLYFPLESIFWREQGHCFLKRSSAGGGALSCLHMYANMHTLVRKAKMLQSWWLVENWQKVKLTHPHMHTRTRTLDKLLSSFLFLDDLRSKIQKSIFELYWIFCNLCIYSEFRRVNWLS